MVAAGSALGDVYTTVPAAGASPANFFVASSLLLWGLRPKRSQLPRRNVAGKQHVSIGGLNRRASSGKSAARPGFGTLGPFR